MLSLSHLFAEPHVLQADNQNHPTVFTPEEMSYLSKLMRLASLAGGVETSVFRASSNVDVFMALTSNRTNNVALVLIKRKSSQTAPEYHLQLQDQPSITTLNFKTIQDTLSAWTQELAQTRIASRTPCQPV